jgi:hypothetical protein
MLTFENAQHLGVTSIMEKLSVSYIPPDSMDRVRLLPLDLNTIGTLISESCTPN